MFQVSFFLLKTVLVQLVPKVGQPRVGAEALEVLGLVLVVEAVVEAVMKVVERGGPVQDCLAVLKVPALVQGLVKALEMEGLVKEGLVPEADQPRAGVELMVLLAAVGQVLLKQIYLQALLLELPLAGVLVELMVQVAAEEKRARKVVELVILARGLAVIVPKWSC